MDPCVRLASPRAVDRNGKPFFGANQGVKENRFTAPQASLP
jgi:hypothetical protein